MYLFDFKELRSSENVIGSCSTFNTRHVNNAR
jgi:hypothetical protein